MENTKEQQQEDMLQSLVTEGKWQEINEKLEDLPVVEVAEFLENQEDEEQNRLLQAFSEEDQGRIFSDFSLDTQLNLFRTLDIRDFAAIFSNMHSEERADLFQELDKKDQVRLLPFLTKKIRENVIALSAYPPDTAGGIMSTDFATITASMTVTEALLKIRKDAPSKKMIYYIYVVDSNMQLLGFVTLKDLIMAEPEDVVSEIVHDNYISAHVDDDREHVAQQVEKYDLVAIPVVNDAEQLLGIVSHDEAIEVIQAEHTEDFEKFMGIVHQEDDVEYMETTSFQHFKKRAVWVVTLAGVGLISGVILHSYEHTLEALTILALYIPMMMDAGGNSGSQAATVVVRALALGDITLKQWYKIIFKEMQVGLMLAICLGVMAFGKIMFLSYGTDIPFGYSLNKIATVISLALSIQVVISTMIGAGLPLLVRRLGGDPAVAASPAITTVVDITGILIYFSMATAFLL